jgi:hypothetical protein
MAIINPNYAITLQARPYNNQWSAAGQTGGGYKTITLQTAIPESFSIQLNSDWSPQFGTALADAIGKLPGGAGAIATAVTNIGTAFGYQPQLKALTAQIWQGTSALEVQVPFILRAEENAMSEVMRPIKQLMYLTLPSMTIGGQLAILKAPFSPAAVAQGVYSGEANVMTRRQQGYAAISLWVGRFFFLPDCVITSVSQAYDAIFDAQGTPLSAKVDVSLRSFFVITTEDIELMFPGGSGSALSLNAPLPTLF